MIETNKTHTVVMPKLGLTMTEATLVEWHKDDGETVEKGDVLFTLETAKSTLEIEAPASGVLHILVDAGETVPVKTPVAQIGGDAERQSGKTPEPQTRKTVKPQIEKAAEQPTDTSAKLVPASPKARALARERGITLEGVRGTGPRGMIVVADVEKVAVEPQVNASPVARNVAEQLGVDLSTIRGSGPRGRIMRADVERAATAKTPTPPEPTPIPSGAIASLSGLRGVIAERLTRSWQERPQVTLITDLDATNLVNARAQLNAEPDVKVSYNAFLVRAVALALRDHPEANVTLTDEGLQQRDQINVGLAVDTERGLMVPVLHDADAKNLLEIDRKLKALAQRALDGDSLPDELTGGCITVTNLGMYEIDAFTPIINPSESVILGVGQIAAKPVVIDGEIVIRQMMTLSLGFDHRVIDGAPAARFLQRIKRLLERPIWLVSSSKNL
jgi:pyruvate dehydrogenase E2 component (dihydrolipoamide acetyltransferase)